MITNYHTTEEIMREVATDLPHLSKKQSHQLARFAREARQRNKFPFTKVYEYTSPNKNKIIYKWIADTRGNTMRPIEAIMFVWHTDKGLACAMPINWIEAKKGAKAEGIVFTPHFISRYNERLGLNLSPMDTIKHMLVNNPTYISKDIDEKICKYSKELENKQGKVAMGCNDGIALGNDDNKGNKVAVTFVSNSMLFTEQSEFAEGARKSIAYIKY